MTEKEALEKSIHKWQRIVDDRRAVDNGIVNCALCQFYDWCENCPVTKRVSSNSCKATPYDKWRRHVGDLHGSRYPLRRQKGCDECTKLAQAELDFLIALRTE